MASIISPTTASSDSLDFTVAAGATATLVLTAAAPAYGHTNSSDKEQVAIQYKAASGVYITVGYLSYKQPAQVIAGAGTYRAHKGITDAAVGVDKD